MAEELNRRDMMVGAGAATAIGLLGGLLGKDAFAAAQEGAKGLYMHKLPPLPYPADALEPVIDKKTVEIHHGKHFAAYVNGLNATIEKARKSFEDGDFSAIKALSRDLAFNGSGVVLHWIYFETIGPNAGGPPAGKVGEQIKKDFGSFETFWKVFSAASKAVEASGWGVLVWEPFSKTLVVMQAEKHQNLTSWGVMPIMVCDVWEHAYYLKYQNRRDEYVDNFQKIINWKKVDELFQKFCLKG